MAQIVSVEDNRVSGARNRRSWIVFALVVAAISAITFYVVGIYGRNAALSALQAQGQTEANLKVALLQAVLERPRAIPFLLARDRDLEDTLRNPEPARKEALSGKLEDLVAGTNASVIYVVGMDGIAISASNWREATSFVGNDYAFRRYFSGALKSGMAEHFALGTVSKRPGLYISHVVGPVSAPLGVVVVKMEFDQLENDWRDTQRPAFVVDENHVVLITSIPSWRFMTTEELQPQYLSAIRESLQFGDASLMPLPFSRASGYAQDASVLHVNMPGGAAADYLRISVPVASTNWVFQYLQPVEKPVADAVREARLIAALILFVIAALAALWMRRRQVAFMTIFREQMAREELEHRVLDRTRDLSQARDRLEAEIASHHATESRLQAVQQDLVHANRLAILGQVAAGVAHEINQPVATIRAYADNSKVFLERRQTKPVVENLGLIANLTERIGAITEDLKALARRGRTAPEPVLIRDVIDGARVLLRSRFTGRLESLSVETFDPDTRVMGSRLRLEQVFINLFQNALEALASRDDGHVGISVETKDETVIVTVADNGPGISPDILDSLFEPFNSSKEKGLGLGLVISKEILADYDGHIEVETGPTGTQFRVHLKKVEE
ncbi:sensor histidine kinase [Neorhizobium alkalisoli]|uniref:C4-dicarboxylate transport sensor protein n=1 Tax=Neorhizobium alkalisoli TaxID=528178 RepID=A0A561R7H1_9HYPH|nr:ATP-binding protein [Neorhizobium alkalisoli]TWF58564.1 two-component system C4-dicarboxylate transport sensor histidine kinase DctB [Neorhizobium alkalisoli]